MKKVSFTAIVILALFLIGCSSEPKAPSSLSEVINSDTHYYLTFSVGGSTYDTNFTQDEFRLSGTAGPTEYTDFYTIQNYDPSKVVLTHREFTNMFDKQIMTKDEDTEYSIDDEEVQAAKTAYNLTLGMMAALKESSTEAYTPVTEKKDGNTYETLKYEKEGDITQIFFTDENYENLKYFFIKSGDKEIWIQINKYKEENEQ